MNKSAKKRRSKRRTKQQRKKNRKPTVWNEPFPEATSESASLPVADEPTPTEVRIRIILLMVLGVVFVWAYWPTLKSLAHSWNTQPDYSHGFLVAPIALYFLWMRRDSIPSFSANLAPFGAVLILLSGVMRWLSSFYYVETLDGWSIPVWVGGVVWMMCGWRIFRWAAPAIIFLVFMVPLPYRLENLLAGPLQAASTKISCFVLQCLHQPALNEGNTILLGEHRLEVARACSGLRIFLGIFAMAYALIVIFPRSWFVKCVMIFGALPIALLANSARIITTGILYQSGLRESMGPLIHDVSGWLMIPVAAAIYLLFLFYIDRLFPTTETVGVRKVIRKVSNDDMQLS